MSDVPFFPDVICSVHQEPIHRKLASIWTYMCSLLRIHSNLLLCRMYPFFLTLYVQYTKNPAVKKWLLFEPICAVYLDNIVTSCCVQCTHYSLPYLFSTPKIQLSKVSSIWAYMYSILRVHITCNVPIFSDLICAVQQEPSRHYLAFILTYMCSVLRIHTNL